MQTNKQKSRCVDSLLLIFFIVILNGRDNKDVSVLFKVIEELVLNSDKRPNGTSNTLSNHAYEDKQFLVPCLNCVL